MANIELDGVNKKIKVDSGDLTLDVPGDIILDADGGDVVFADGGTNLLKVTNSSSDVVLQPQVDTKDIVFKQYDGTVVATVEDNATFNIPASKLAIGGTAVTSTAAELNLIDGGTARGTTAIADGDGVLINDDGTMRMTTVQTLKTYIGGFDVSSITGATALTDTPAGTDEFVLSDNGTLKRIDFSLMQNTPHWEVGLSSDQGIPNSTMTKLQFAVDRKNASGSPDYWDNSNYRTQNLTAGDYFAYLNLTFEGNAGSSTAYILIKRYNSSNVEQQSSGKALDQWTKVGQYHGSIFSVASGDYIAYELWQNSGGTVTQLYEANDGSLCFGGGFKIA